MLKTLLCVSLSSLSLLLPFHGPIVGQGDSIIHQPKPKVQKPLVVPVLKPQEPVESIYVAPVVNFTAPVQTAPGGCTTYFSGDVYLDNIIRYESGGRSCATNPGDCFGLLQACPGAPLRDACGGDPTCQIDWFIANKTGGRTWAQVWQHELDFGWW